MTRAQEESLVAVLRATHPRQPVPAETVALYVDRLMGLDYEPARLAVIELVNTVTFWPSVADVRDAYKARRPKPKVNVDNYEPTEQERLDMLEKVRAYASTIGRKS